MASPDDVRLEEAAVTDEINIFAAARAGDLALIKKYLAEGGDTGVRDAERNTPVHAAAETGHANAVRALCKGGFDPDARRPPRQWTALMHACYHGDPAVAEALIDARADVTAVEEDGTTPGELFDAAVGTDARDKVRAALAARFRKVGVKHIYGHEAARTGNLTRVQWYLDAGGDVNARDSNNYTMLHWACREGHYNAVAFLLKRGAEVDSKDGKKWTPLYVASMNGQFDMCKLLMERGAAVNARTHDNRTPLHGACRFGHHDIVFALLERGAMVDSRDGNDNTPLHWACERGHYDLVRELVNRGAQTSSRDRHQCTPLHWACMGAEAAPDIAKELVTRGAEVEARDDERRTALHLAADKGFVSVVKELVIRGADISAQDRGGYTPLHYACAKGHERAVFELLDRGCDTAAMDAAGKTAAEVVGSGLPPGHVAKETQAKIERMIRDGPRPPQKAKPLEAEVRCLCALM